MGLYSVYGRVPIEYCVQFLLRSIFFVLEISSLFRALSRLQARVHLCRQELLVGEGLEKQL